MYFSLDQLSFSIIIENREKRNDMVKVLIQNGCNLNIPSSEGLRCLDVLLSRLLKDVHCEEPTDGDKDGESYIRVDMSLFNLLVQSGSELCPAMIQMGHYEG